MLVFLDFEASSLSERSYPIEVAWVFEDGREEAHLIRPAPEWTDWDPAAQAIHGIDRAVLERQGRDHSQVAARMVEQLAGHDLYASAPSWDGKWLSVLLRAAGLPRHSLRLTSTDRALEEAVRATLGELASPSELDEMVRCLVAGVEQARPHRREHRALADAGAEHARWAAARAAAEEHARRVNAKRPAG